MAVSYYVGLVNSMCSYLPSACAHDSNGVEVGLAWGCLWAS